MHQLVNSPQILLSELSPVVIQPKRSKEMTYLYLKADIHPDLSKRVEVEAAFAELMRASLSEPGCLLYDLVVDEENPVVWHMFEKWASKAAWNDHMNTQHVAKIRQLEPNLILAPTKLNFYTSVLSPADRS